MRRLSWLMALVIAACQATAPTPISLPSPSEPTKWPSDSQYGRLFAQVGQDGLVSRDTALQAFSLAIAELPGVAVPAGDPPALFERADGTFAVDWIERYYDQLTADQKAVVDEALGPLPGSVTIAPPQGGGGPPDIRAAAAAASPAATLDPQIQFAIDVVTEATKIIAANLGRTLGIGIGIGVNATHQHPTADALAYASLGTGGSGQPICRMYMEPEFRGLDTTDQKTTLAHETFHCFQFVLMRQMGTDIRNVPDWLVEGQAEWAGEAVFGPSSIGTGMWAAYLESPNSSLFNRTYDATGFYEHLVRVGMPSWTVLDAMLKKGTSQGAFEAANAGQGTFLDTWASGLFHDSRLPTPEWDEPGRWTTTARSEPVKVIVENGQSQDLNVLPGANLDVVAAGNSDLMQLDFNGHVRVRVNQSDWVDPQTMLLCTQQKFCVCPSGSHYEGPQYTVADDSMARIGLTGAATGATGTVLGLAFDGFCKPGEGPSVYGSPGPKPGQSGGTGNSPCGSSCAGSNGDPHLGTVDAHRYDLQNAAEMVLLRSPDGSIEVQARQEVPPNGKAVTINSAVAAKVDGHRVGVYTTKDGLELHVDGQVATAPADGLAVGAGKVMPHLHGYEIDFPDGTVMWAIAVGSWGINAQIRPSDALRKDAMGLLGTVLPGGVDVPALPDGTRLARAVDAHDRYQKIYGQFAPAWQVTQQTTLFDYAAGRTPASYVIKGLPSETQVRTIDQADPTHVQQAQTACGSVLDAGLREDCVFDISFTGIQQYLELYGITDQFLQTGGTALDNTIPPLQPYTGPLPEGFDVIVPAMSSIQGDALAPDGTLYLSLSEANDAHELLAIDSATGAVKAKAAVKGGNKLAWASGSIWVGDLGGGVDCAVSRVDPGSLAVQAEVSVPCDILGSSFAPLDGSIWFVDRTSADINGKGGKLRRIDPVTNKVGSTSTDAIELPFLNGYLIASDNEIIYGDPTKDGWYRLVAGSSTLEPVGNPPGAIHPAGEGIWAQQEPAPPDARMAQFFTHPGTPDVTVAFDGALVAADESAVYAEIPDSFDSTPTLWRFPIDGGPPAPLALGTTIRTSTAQDLRLGYFDNDPLLVETGRIVKLWTVPAPTDPTQHAVVMQRIDLP